MSPPRTRGPTDPYPRGAPFPPRCDPMGPRLAKPRPRGAVAPPGLCPHWNSVPVGVLSPQSPISTKTLRPLERWPHQSPVPMGPHPHGSVSPWIPACMDPHPYGSPRIDPPHPMDAHPHQSHVCSEVQCHLGGAGCGAQPQVPFPTASILMAPTLWPPPYTPPYSYSAPGWCPGPTVSTALPPRPHFSLLDPTRTHWAGRNVWG